jgi:hypothetical protein
MHCHRCKASCVEFFNVCPNSRLWLMLCLVYIYYILSCVGSGVRRHGLALSIVPFTWGRRQSRLRNVAFEIKNRTMDNAQKSIIVINFVFAVVRTSNLVNEKRFLKWKSSWKVLRYYSGRALHASALSTGSTKSETILIKFGIFYVLTVLIDGEKWLLYQPVLHKPEWRRHRAQVIITIICGSLFEIIRSCLFYGMLPVRIIRIGIRRLERVTNSWQIWN